MSDRGTVIPLEKGPAADEFFLTFEQLGSASNVVIEAPPIAPPPPADVPREPSAGIRDFAEINATMSAVTGVPTSNSEIAGVYDTVRTAMPVETGIGGFISSQQMGVTQLAIKYCSVLIDDTTARANFFPTFDFNAAPAAAFANRALVTDPLIDNIVGRGLGTQPDLADLATEVNALIDRLTSCGGSCATPARTVSVMKASCAAVLGSAAMLVQ